MSLTRLGAATGLEPASKAVVGGRPPKPKADREPSRVLAHHLIVPLVALLRTKFCMHLVNYILHISPAIACNRICLLRVSSGAGRRCWSLFQRTSRTEYLRNVRCVWRYGLNKE